jgi:trans-aconitate 2-methyltransferase
VTTRDWDAQTYDRVSDPQFEWGLEVLERLALEGDEAVLDAGCGSGRLTAELIARLPRGRVVAVDASPSMVELTRQRLRETDRAVVADLAQLEIGEQVDAVFSTATFHWIPDHDALFRRLQAVLRPGGRLIAQCGGAGNLTGFHGEGLASVAQQERFAPYFADWAGPWNFATPQDTERRLAAAGFAEVVCSLQDRPVRPDEPLAFITTVCLGHHLERLPDGLRKPFAEAVLEAAGGDDLEVDYVRLNISARKPA